MSWDFMYCSFSVTWYAGRVRQLPKVRTRHGKQTHRKTHEINVSFSAVVVHMRCVERRKTLLMRLRVAGIWSTQDHSAFFELALRAERPVVAVFPPRAFLALGAGVPGASVSACLTFSAAETNHWSKNAYISSGVLCAR